MSPDSAPDAYDFEALFDEAPCGFIFLSPDWRVVQANKTFLSWTNYELDTIVGQPVTDLLDIAGRIYFGTHFMPVLRLQHSFNEVALNFVLADGTRLPVLVNASERRDADDAARMILISVFNATDRRRYEADLLETRNALRIANETLEKRVEEAVAERLKAERALIRSQRMEAIGNLSAGIAHDFNNLLQVIGGNIQLLKKHVSSDASIRRISNAMRGIDRGAKLASQLLAFGGQQLLEPKVFNAGRLVKMAGESLLSTLKGEVDLVLVEPEIDGSTSADGLNVRLDKGQFENALLNLALNARDAMRKPDSKIASGTLTIEVRRVDVGPEGWNGETVGKVPRGDFVKVSVTDTGTGMTDTVAQNVFEPFFTTKANGEGTGLGLSMLYGFVTQSQGHITIDSELGVGTCMSIWLPHVREPEHLLEDFNELAVAKGGATVLVVDDDALLRSVVTELLEELGYVALEAENGPDALAITEKRSDIDLLLTDIVMPGGLDGAALAKKVRKIRPDIAIVFTTGYADAAARIELEERSGAILKKPYDHGELARIIEISLSRAEKEAAVEVDETDGVIRQGSNQKLSVADEAPETRIEKPATSLSVLVVEDEPLIRMDIVEMITDMGFHVVDVGNGLAAVTALENKSFDVLLTDVNLPGLSGKDVAQKAVSAHPDIRIIFITGENRSPVLNGADATLLQKPFSEDDLKNAFLL